MDITHCECCENVHIRLKGFKMLGFNVGSTLLKLMINIYLEPSLEWSDPSADLLRNVGKYSAKLGFHTDVLISGWLLSKQYSDWLR